MSASSVLAAYRYPEVESSLRTDFTPERLLASAGDTLSLVSAERHQRLRARQTTKRARAEASACVRLRISPGGINDGQW